MPPEPYDAEREIVRHFDEARAARELQEAEEAVIIDGITDPDVKRVAKDVLLLIRNPDKTLPPML